MKYVLHVVIFCIHVQQISGLLNSYEMKMSLDLAKELKIRQCVIVRNRNEDLTNEFKKFSSVNIPITILSYYSLITHFIYTDKPSFYTGLIFKENDLQLLELISRIYEKANFTYEFRKFIWLTFLENETLNLRNQKLNIPYDCEFIVIQPTNEVAYKITEIYVVKNKPFSLNFGTWDWYSGLKTPNVSFYHRRQNFEKIEVNVCSLNNINSENLALMIARDTISGLTDMMNITYRDNLVDVTATDAIIDLSELGMDLISFPQPYRNFSSSALDIIGPLYDVELNWYIKYPRVEMRSDYYFQPFDTDIWLGLLFVTSIGTFCIIVSQNLIRNRKRPIIDNLFLGLESFCNQCGNDVIEDSYLRLICIMLRLIAVILIGGLYGATITSFFAVESFRPPFTNKEEFVTNGEYRLVLHSERSANNFKSWIWQDNKSETIFENFTQIIKAKSSKDFYENICYDKYVALEFNDIVDAYDLQCRVYRIPERYGRMGLGLYIQKISPFRKTFSKNLIRLRENGMLMVRLETSKRRIRQKDLDSVRPIEVEQVIQVLTIPFTGILLGTIIIVIELFKKHRILTGTVIHGTEKRQLTWYGHGRIMPDERLPKQVWDWVPKERKKKGRSRKSWMEGVQSALNLTDQQWENRDEWKLGTGQRRSTF